MSTLRGIRGANQVSADTSAAIDDATRKLLLTMVDHNEIDPGTIVAIWFTQTPDLKAAHAPAAARSLGWRHVPLLGALEAEVDGELPRVVRALMIAPVEAELDEVRHVYLGAARTLREDLSQIGEVR